MYVLNFQNVLKQQKLYLKWVINIEYKYSKIIFALENDNPIAGG